MALLRVDESDWITDNLILAVAGKDDLESINALSDLSPHREAAVHWIIRTIDQLIAGQGIYPSTVTAAAQLHREPFKEAAALDVLLRAKTGSDSDDSLASYLGEIRERRRVAFEAGLRVALSSAVSFTVT